jgi:hypothetical protein
MTNYLEHATLPVIDFEFPGVKRKEIDELINNLKLKDINSDEKFENTLEAIKRKVLLNPVKFEKPKIIDHYQTEKTYPPSFDNMLGGTRQVFIVSVEYPFSGDTELFQYKPNGYSFGPGDMPYIFQPTGRSIVVEVESFSLDNKNKILEEAQRHMNLTFQFIDSNNTFIENWSYRIEPTIESQLRNHKEKLEKLYES